MDNENLVLSGRGFLLFLYPAQEGDITVAEAKEEQNHYKILQKQKKRCFT